MDNKELEIFEFVENNKEHTEHYSHEQLLRDTIELVNLYSCNAEFKHLLAERKEDVENLQLQFKETYGHLNNDDPERVLALQMLSRLGIMIYEPEREAEIMKREEEKRKKRDEINQHNPHQQIQDFHRDENEEKS